MAAKPVGKHVLITGPPGIGKTTLVQSVCGKLVDKGLRLRGFYTEELREGRNRIGFDVVSLTTKSRSPLARLNGSVIIYHYLIRPQYLSRSYVISLLYRYFFQLISRYMQ
jgi:nucleoside-triphosphatase THEP1